MKNMQIIQVPILAGSTELAGASAGGAWFQSARPHIDAGQPGWYAVDFSNVRLATVSWLREGLVALQKYAAAMRPDIKLVAVNLSGLVREELSIALEATNSVMLVANLAPDFDLQEPAVLGRLDPALRETLGAIQGLSEFDAPLVSKVLPRVALPAANNRLAALEHKGILKSERRGRTRVYQPILEDLRYGT